MPAASWPQVCDAVFLFCAGGMWLFLGLWLLVSTIRLRDETPGGATCPQRLPMWSAVQGACSAAAGVMYIAFGVACLVLNERHCEAAVYKATSPRSHTAVLTICPIMCIVLFTVIWWVVGLVWSIEAEPVLCGHYVFLGRAHSAAAAGLMAVTLCWCRLCGSTQPVPAATLASPGMPPMRSSLRSGHEDAWQGSPPRAAPGHGRRRQGGWEGAGWAGSGSPSHRYELLEVQDV
eukprot:TRINITY_DN14502_c0_g1_i3.p2 TRINITY_DN14502_c0_g1~~TRINITY_DN14502_c0_g1_i3.p2  ORF type:complete len:233 (+),score=26.80 TRINITY_DN14502_c0_g1_i3:87-785(+)